MTTIFLYKPPKIKAPKRGIVQQAKYIPSQEEIDAVVEYLRDKGRRSKSPKKIAAVKKNLERANYIRLLKRREKLLRLGSEDLPPEPVAPVEVSAVEEVVKSDSVPQLIKSWETNK